MSGEIVREAALRSLALGLVVAAIAGAAGLIVSWLVSRTDFPGKRWLAGLFSVPYAIPSYLLGMGWVVLGNPTVGLLKDILPGSGSYGFWGMALVLASYTVAFPYLELRAGFERLDPALEEAARMSGAGPLRVFRDVSFPLLWPALVNGMCLAFLYAISTFGVPALLGMPSREFVLTTLVYTQIRLGGPSGLASALELSLVLLVFALLALGLSAWLGYFLRKWSGSIGGAKSSRPSLIRLGGFRWPAAAFSWGLFGIAIVLPWFALGISALAPVAGRYSPSQWTARNFDEVLALPDFRDGLIHSIGLAAVAASLVVLLGFLLAFAAVRRKKRWAAWLIEALGIPFATPGTVLAILLILFVGVLGRLGLDIDAPLLVMGLAYLVKFAAVGARSLVTAYGQVHPALEEAARVSGARTWELLWTIWRPLLKMSWKAAFVLAALPMLTELTMSVLLTGPGASTLGTVLFDLQEYRDQPMAAALGWMILTGAFVIGFLTRERREAWAT